MGQKTQHEKDQVNRLRERMSQVLCQICEILELDQEDFRGAVEAVGEGGDNNFMEISFERMKGYLNAKVPADYLFEHCYVFQRTILTAIEWCISEEGYILTRSDKSKVRDNWKKKKSKCEDLLFQVFEAERKRRYNALNALTAELGHDAFDASLSVQFLDNIRGNRYKKFNDDYVIPEEEYDAFRRLLLNDCEIFISIQSIIGEKLQKIGECQRRQQDIDLAVLPPLS